MDDSNNSKDELKAQLLAAEKTYSSMPKGCNCNKKGREKNAARNTYMKNVLAPLRKAVKDAK